MTERAVAREKRKRSKKKKKKKKKKKAFELTIQNRGTILTHTGPHYDLKINCDIQNRSIPAASEISVLFLSSCRPYVPVGSPIIHIYPSTAIEQCVKRVSSHCILRRGRRGRKEKTATFLFLEGWQFKVFIENGGF
jgi:hypothetical protein